MNVNFNMRLFARTFAILNRDHRMSACLQESTQYAGGIYTRERQ